MRNWIKKNKNVSILIGVFVFFIVVGAFAEEPPAPQPNEQKKQEKVQQEQKPEPEPEQTPEEARAEIMNSPEYKNAKPISYAELFRNADKHTLKYFKFKGEVIQVLGQPGEWDLRVNVTEKGDEYYSYYDDTIYVSSDSDERVIEGDIIKFTGLMSGPYTYETVMGGEITIPLVVIYEHELVGRIDE